VALRSTLEQFYAHPLYGFLEDRSGRLPQRSNPHMHLFEAALAWIAVDDDPAWRRMADGIAVLRDSLKSADVGVSVLREAIGIVSTAAMAGVRLATRQHLTTHDILIQDFAQRVRDGISPTITPEEGRESIRVLDLLVAQLDKEPSRSKPASPIAS
jgi:hypothetical protein